MPIHHPTRFIAAVAVAATCAAVGVVAGTTASAASCSDIDVSFARGTGEPAGLGSVGGPFVSSLTSDLSGYSVSSYAVNYAANTSQSSAGPGATDMSNHISSVAASCPNTRFVIGGYSQGATVTDIAVGIRTGSSSGTPIPANLASRVLAVVVFGNPLGIQRQTIATASATYGPKSKDYCNTGDPVCGGGSNTAAHLQYVSNGSTTQGAQFAANLVKSAAAPSPTPTSTPTATPTIAPTSTPTPTPTIAPVTCIRSSNTDHVAAGRARSLAGGAYAIGSNNYLGLNSRYVFTSLKQTAATTWTRVSSC